MKAYTGLLIAMILLPATCLAQRNAGEMKGWRTDSRYCMMYQADAEIEIEGVITSLDRFVPEKGASYGLEVTLKTTSGNKIVHLGPGWYMEKQEMQLEIGDRIEVEGAEVEFDNRNVIMASEVERGGQEMKLRDAYGRPVWRKSRQKRL